MDNFKIHLIALIQLAISDQDFDEAEEALIYSIGKGNGIPEKEIAALIRDNLSKKPLDEIQFGSLTFEEKFEFVYNIVQLIKIDREVFLSEIRFAEGLAQKIGFEKSVIKELSAKIYSDPRITADRELLKRAAKKFEL